MLGMTAGTRQLFVLTITSVILINAAFTSLVVVYFTSRTRAIELQFDRSVNLQLLKGETSLGREESLTEKMRGKQGSQAGKMPGRQRNLAEKAEDAGRSEDDGEKSAGDSGLRRMVFDEARALLVPEDGELRDEEDEMAGWEVLPGIGLHSPHKDNIKPKQIDKPKQALPVIKPPIPVQVNTDMPHRVDTSVVNNVNSTNNVDFKRRFGDTYLRPAAPFPGPILGGISDFNNEARNKYAAEIPAVKVPPKYVPQPQPGHTDAQKPPEVNLNMPRPIDPQSFRNNAAPSSVNVTKFHPSVAGFNQRNSSLFEGVPIRGLQNNSNSQKQMLTNSSMTHAVNLSVNISYTDVSYGKNSIHVNASKDVQQPNIVIVHPVPGRNGSEGSITSSGAVVIPAAVVQATKPENHVVFYENFTDIEHHRMLVSDLGLRIKRKFNEVSNIVTELQTHKKEFRSLFHNINFKVEGKKAFGGRILRYDQRFTSPCWVNKEDQMMASEEPYYRHNPYLSHSLNNCDTWAEMERCERVMRKRKAHIRIRCMPSFHLGGARESGTEELFAALNTHRQLVSPACSHPSYWNRGRFEGQLDPLYSIADYADLFDTNGVQNFVDAEYRFKTIIGEASPDYLTDFYHWKMVPLNKNLDEPQYILAHTLKFLYTSTKLIFMLRDPVERLYAEFTSSYPGHDPVMFHQQVMRALEEYQKCLNTSTLRSCAYSPDICSTDLRKICHMISASMYYVYLKDWLVLFPTDSMRLVKSEEFFTDPESHIEALWWFLGTDKISVDQLEEARSRANLLQPAHPGMFPVTRTLLQIFYKPSVAALVNITGNANLQWGY